MISHNHAHKFCLKIERGVIYTRVQLCTSVFGNFFIYILFFIIIVIKILQKTCNSRKYKQIFKNSFKKLRDMHFTDTYKKKTPRSAVTKINISRNIADYICSNTFASFAKINSDFNFQDKQRFETETMGLFQIRPDILNTKIFS